MIFRVLHNLLILDGERISYRSLDVEQIGSVYETIMGFRLEKAGGRSIAIKPAKAHGAPVTINLEALLAVPAKDRGKWLKEQADQTVTGAALNALEERRNAEALVAALETQGRPRPDAEHRPARQHGPAAERRTPALRFALHATQL